MYFLAELVIPRPSLRTPGLTLSFETFFWIIIYYTTCTTKSLPLRQELSLCPSPNASLDAFVKVVGKIWESNKASGKKKSPLPLFQFFGLAFLMKRPAVFAMPCGVLIQTLPSHVWLKPENGHTHPCPSISQKDTAKVTRRRWKLEGRQPWMELLGVSWWWTRVPGQKASWQVYLPKMPSSDRVSLRVRKTKEGSWDKLAGQSSKECCHV